MHSIEIPGKIVKELKIFVNRFGSLSQTLSPSSFTLCFFFLLFNINDDSTLST